MENFKCPYCESDLREIGIFYKRITVTAYDFTEKGTFKSKPDTVVDDEGDFYCPHCMESIYGAEVFETLDIED